MHLAIPTRLDFLLWTLQRLRWPTMYNTHRGRHEQVGMVRVRALGLGLGLGLGL